MFKLKDLINEDKGDLLDLVGKEPDDDLTSQDAEDIGRQVANMDDEEEQKSYLSMMSALGGYYGGSNPEAEQTLDDLRTAAFDAYNQEKEDE